MGEILRRAEYLLSEINPQRLAPARAEVAFIGRSNVGKSSLLNALCQRRGLAIVSKTPGRTRAINIFAVSPLRWLVDLPGYGYAAGPLSSREGWSHMIEGYLTSRPSLRGLFLLIDSKVGPTPLDHEMREWLKVHGLSYRLVGNKIDQVKPSQQRGQKKRIAEGLHVPLSEIQWVSATEETGIASLRQDIVKLLEWNSQHETPVKSSRM
jgi:GTP-binding protein